jgi:hypothetical protein
MFGTSGDTAGKAFMDEEAGVQKSGDHCHVEYHRMMELIGRITQWEVVLETSVDSLLALLVGDGRIVPIIFGGSGTKRKLEKVQQIVDDVPQLFSSFREDIKKQVEDAKNLITKRNALVHSSIAILQETDEVTKAAVPKRVVRMDRRTGELMTISSTDLLQLVNELRQCALEVGRLAARISVECDDRDKPRYVNVFRKLKK